MRIRRIDTQTAETVRTNDLAKLHQGITMLHAGNSITQAGGVEYLHRLAKEAKEAKENKQQQEEVLRVFCDFLKHMCRCPRRNGITAIAKKPGF